MTVIIWAAVSVLLFIIFVIALLAAIVGKRVWLMIVAVLALGGGMLAGGIAFVRFSSTAVKVVSNAASDRTAEEVYAEEFGRPVTACGQVVDYYDPTVRVVNVSRQICFSSCTAETARILQLRRYDVVKRSTAEVMRKMSGECCRNFVTEERFGNALLECLASEGTDAYAVYVSLDSTRVYYVREIK